MLILLFVIIGISLSSCASSKTYTPVSTTSQKPILLETPEINTEIEQANVSQYTQYNFKGDYNNFDFIYTYGVDKERIINIISSITPKYFDGISELEVIYSNSESIRGWYYPDNAKITIYDFNYGDSFIRRNILHELKHHYCWTKGYTWNTIEESHQGCFLHTPIDDEFGFVK